ncbi:MAG TPA: SusC/RagA family TonB-linked outer membrane protein [Flavisolibacter sp.]|jgi:TonB-linked SusC/RagA family outer membrane protein|nr:SusC/RagA family TonB-linked outer membrane protein [Flavisolibacter sp.]
MRRLLYLAFLNIGMLFFFTGYAQERAITGRVTSSDDNKPLSGVTVSVKGANRQATTDASGNFTIQARTGDVLQFSFVGRKTSEITVQSSNNIELQLSSKDNMLNEVVVTAMDIKRNPRELGYSVQKVGGNEIAETKRENFLNSLQGRVAGLSITPTNGQAGASSSIVLRGFNSLSLSNQPLFIVDGIIVDNSTLNETSNGGSGLGLASDRPNRNNDYTNRIADLNPNDIESVTVLKGPEATALYGSQASSGAIVITTKRAVPGRVSVTYDNAFRIQEVTRFAKLNNDYSPGLGGVAGNSLNYFGPAYAAGTKDYDNLHHFFRTGFSQTHNIGADWGTKNVGFRFSGSYLDQKGVIPTNDFKKGNLRLANTTKIGKYIEITPAIQYINSTNDKPLRNAGGYLLGLYIWPKDNDIRNFEDAEGNKMSIFAADPTTEIDNPLYNVTKNKSQDKTERYIATAGININPFDWLSISGRFGYDTYKSQGFTYYHPLSNLSSRTQLGALDNYWRNYYGYNHTITATARKKFGKIGTRLLAGTMWQDYKTEMYSIFGTNLVDSIGVNGKMYKNNQIVTDANFAQLVGDIKDSSITKTSTRVRLLRNNFGEYNKSISRQLAYFGEVGLSYNDVVFVSYTHRFEASSIFPKVNRNYNYPGLSASLIVSDVFPKIKGRVFDYVKFRGSLAGTARVSDPYRNQSVFVNNFASGNGPVYSYGFDNNNPDLAPEKQSTYEVGTEFRLFNNRLSLDAAYYNTLTKGQISQGFRASYATGFVLNTQNAASTRNEGVELTLDLAAVRKTDFTWNIRFNFAHMWNKVLELPAAIQKEYYIADTWLYGNARGGLIRGNPATTITGYHYSRNNTGRILINPTTGLPVIDATFDVIGDRLPKFTLGTLNSFRYKNWSLSFLWDLKVGGDVFNATEMYLTIAGKSTRTNDRFTPRVIEGVLNDGKQNTANPTPNTIVIVPGYTSDYYRLQLPEEEFVQHDVNYLRLRDLTLNYYLSQNALRKLRAFKSASLFITGNDLVLLTNYNGADPSVNGNTAGASGIGAFGFDYGSLPTPLGLNFGIRVGF